jgi:His/Glu/Gln/Arg/opine family amino acid ABC transporter permease subunit
VDSFFFDIGALQAEQEALIQGFYTTIGVTLLSAFFAISMALGLCFLQTLKHPTLDAVTQAWVELLRNIPLLIQIYFFYKALPVTGLVLPPLACGILALSLHASAYLAEVFRSGMAAIPIPQTESAMSLGLSPWQRFRLVLGPQCLPVILPPMSSVIVNVVKNSSLLAFITVSDLFYVVYKGGVTFFHYIEFFSMGLLGYLVLTYGVTLTFQVLEAWATPEGLRAESSSVFSPFQILVRHPHRLLGFSQPLFARIPVRSALESENPRGPRP